MTKRILAAAVVVVLAGPALAEDWPQFRGPNATGVSASKNLPEAFSETENVLWKADLGEGIASPVVVGGRVFATALTGPKTFTLSAREAATGKPLWTRALDTGPLPRITPPNSHAASTPAADGQRVYVYFSTLGLMAFDAATGADAWKLPLDRPAYLMDWGAASSPVVFRGTVYFALDDDLNPYLVAADAATGKVRWKAPRPDMLAGYAVPVFCEAGGRTDLVLAGTGKLKGYDPETGKERWTCNTLVRTVMTTPAVKDGVIYVAVQSYGDSSRTLKFALLEWMDANQDKRLARTEVPREFHDRFDASDADKDGFVADDELDTAFQSSGNRVGGGNTIQAVRGGGTGDVTRTHLVWNVTKPYPSNLTSPLVSGDRLLVVKAGGVSTCLSTATGNTVWDRERIDNRGDHYASPVAADGKVYVAGRNGFVVVLADGPALKVLAKNDLGGEIIATPAIANDRLYVRTREKLFCVGKK